MKQRILSILLVLVVLLTTLPVGIYAADDIKTDTPYRITTQASPESDQLAVGDTVTVRLTVESSDSAVQTFSAYDLKLRYDVRYLAFEACYAPDAEVTADAAGGMLRVKGYGTEKNCASPVAILVFRILEAGETHIAVEEAKIDDSDHAGLRDAPKAKLPEAPLVIRAAQFFSVTLQGEGLQAETLVASASHDYCFLIEDPELFQYQFSIASGGTDITEKLIMDQRSGACRIPGDAISSDLLIVAIRTPMQFFVTLTGDDLAGGNIAQYLTDYQFTLNRDKGYTYTIAVTIQGNPYHGFREEQDVYTIPGTDITGNIHIAVTKKANASGQVNVTFVGNGAKDASGESKATKGSAYTFTIQEEQGYTYTVLASSGGKRADCTYDAKNDCYRIPADKVVGDLTITITKTVTIEVTEYLDMGQETMYLILYRGQVETGSVPKFDGRCMYWSECYGAYAWLMTSVDGKSDVEHLAEERIAASAGSIAGTVNYSGNVDLSLNTDQQDAALIQNIYNLRYTLENLEMLKFLNADLNGDKKLDIRDAAAVIGMIVTEQEDQT